MCGTERLRVGWAFKAGVVSTDLDIHNSGALTCSARSMKAAATGSAAFTTQ
jgi:hypothetical protein